MAMVGDHKLTIDDVAPYTIDKAFKDGYYYADKAPGLSVLAIPSVFLISQWKGLPTEVYGEDFNYKPAYSLFVYFATLSTVGLLAASAAAALFQWCLARGSSLAGAAVAALACSWASLSFPWSTVFFGHAAAGALLLLGFIALSAATGRAAVGRLKSGGLTAVAAGLLLGAAFVVEYTAGPAVAIIAACCGAEALAQRVGLNRVVLIFGASAIGLMATLAPLAVYNAAAFGSPLALGYASVQGFAGMETGFFGISTPRLRVMYWLLAGEYRGLIPLSPILLLAPVGVFFALRKTGWRTIAFASVLVFAWYLTMNSGYYYWYGGYSTGPRHLLPSLPLLAAMLPPLWDAAGRRVRWLMLLLLVLTLGIAVVVASIDVAAPELEWRPVEHYLIPLLLKGNLDRLVANLAGLHGIAALIPMLMIWALVGYPFGVILYQSLSTRRSQGRPLITYP